MICVSPGLTTCPQYPIKISLASLAVLTYFLLYSYFIHTHASYSAYYNTMAENILRSMHDDIIDRLEDLRFYLRRDHIEYFLKCVRKRRSCIIVIILRNPQTHKKVLDLRLKVRNRQELTCRLEGILTSCHYFAMGVSPSGSPEY